LFYIIWQFSRISVELKKLIKCPLTVGRVVGKIIKNIFTFKINSYHVTKNTLWILTKKKNKRKIIWKQLNIHGDLLRNWREKVVIVFYSMPCRQTSIWSIVLSTWTQQMKKVYCKGRKMKRRSKHWIPKKNNCFNPGAFVFVIEIRRLTLKRLALVIKDPYNRVADGWEKQQAGYNTQFWCYNKCRVLQWDLFREIKHYNTFTCCSY